MSTYKITTLIDNLAPRSPLVGEHGLSILIEAPGKNILMDVGQGNGFIKNAKTLGIDLSSITDLVISHGHYDHTGGLEEFIKINKTAKIYIKPDAVKNKLRKNKTYIGIPKNIREMLQERATFVSENIEISKNIHLIANIETFNQEETNYQGMFINEEGAIVQDTFEDELFIAIIKDNKVSIINGCAHKGITNIMRTTTKIFNMPINILFGGLHLNASGEKRRKNIIEQIKNINAEKIITNHCTGLLAFHELKTIFENKVFYGYSGETFSI